MEQKNITNSLFKDSDFEKTGKQDSKVICLGLEFDNETERLNYFRQELRNKLSELRNIEGFPEGNDEDIIKLSNPPYYTACPNPWLNEIINEWEKDKKELENKHKRKSHFDVKRPYTSDISEGKNNPIYMAHAYHTKVPHPAIMRYILHYTQPGDIIFDGFCGTGMTGVAAQLCGNKEEVSKLSLTKPNIGIRHAICSDLSPIASLVAANYNLHFDNIDFEQKALRILKDVEEDLGWMNETEVDGHKAKINYTIWSDAFVCPSCGHEIVLWNEAVSDDTKSIRESFPCPHCGFTCSKKNMGKAWETIYDSLLGTTVTMNKKVPVRINYTINGKRGEKPLSEFDKDLIEKISAIDITNYHTHEILNGDESGRIVNYGISHMHQFYTKRNFLLLYKVYEKVRGNVKLTSWFTSVLLNLTKMYKFRTDRKGSMLYGTLYFPSLSIEYNPLNNLKNKIKDFAYRYTTTNSAISLMSATNIFNISNNSIDYIFVDPPFGSNLMYSELNSLWEGWIKVHTNNNKEAIVNKSQSKTLFDYHNLMYQSFLEFYRILKPGKWMTVEFSNTSASVWNSIQSALQSVGFIVVNVAALDKKQGSFKAVTTTTAVKQDLVISCYKPSEELTLKFETSLNKNSNVMDFVEELLIHLPVHIEKDQSTTAIIERSPKILYDKLISYYVQHGYIIPMDAQEFQNELKERFIERDGMYFTASQALEYEEKKKTTNGIVPTSLFISSEADGIEWLKRVLEAPQTYSEIQPEWMKNMIPAKKGDVLPELSIILEENFIKDDDGKWRNPDPEKSADLEILRSRKMMKQFNLYLEQAQKPRAKRMKDTRLEVLRYGFKECYKQKDYMSIILVGDHIQESLLQEDEILLQYYDIALSKM